MTFRADGDAASKPVDIAFLFQVLIEDEVVGDFLAVEELSRRVEPFLYPEGGNNHAPHVLVSPGEYREIVLRWGMMERDSLFEWMQRVEVGASFRMDIQILQLSRQRDVVRSYSVEGAWPVEWKGASLNSMESRVPVEEIRLVYSTLQMQVHSV